MKATQPQQEPQGLPLRSRRILIIDDDEDICLLLSDVLAQEGASVITAYDGLEGLRQFYAHQPDLVIIDLMMPEMDGWETTRRLRELSDTPIVMLTAIHDDASIVKGLDLGAVGYVTKPFTAASLTARVRALLRHTKSGRDAPEPDSYVAGHIAFYMPERRVFVDGEPVSLTKTEFKLLSYLVQNAGMALSFQQILQHVWGGGYQERTEYVHAYVSRLRHKLEKDPKRPEYLLTEYGFGYRLKKKPSV